MAAVKHKHEVQQRFWLGSPYYWCEDKGCGLAVKVTKDNAAEDPEKLLDKASRERKRATKRD
jgi:hypothetical protein